jgi:hypothetical protein
MRKYLIILFLFISNLVLSQPFTYSGYIYNAGGSVAQNVGVDLYVKQISQYTITNPTYSTAAAYNSGTAISASDDVVLGPYNIGFSFVFFGTTYTQFYVCSNGWIGFSSGQTNGYTSQYIPNSSAPKNVIMADWEDLYPGSSNIYYQTIGTSPNRKLVVSFYNCPHYSCRSSYHTFQFVLYESTNVIDLNMLSKPLCGSNTATQGLINSTGNTAVPTNGRNSSNWSISSGQTVRFTPSTASTTFTYYSTHKTNSSGLFNINPGLDVSNYQFQLQIPTPTPTTQISFNDINTANNKVITRNFNSLDYYRYDVNNDGNITISDLYSIYMIKNGRFTTWPNSTQSNRILILTHYNVVNASNSDLRNTYPGTFPLILTSPTNGGTSTYYLINTGYSNSSIISY